VAPQPLYAAKQYHRRPSRTLRRGGLNASFSRELTPPDSLAATSATYRRQPKKQAVLTLKLLQRTKGYWLRFFNMSGLTFAARPTRATPSDDHRRKI
jgi:hypothetical protein